MSRCRQAKMTGPPAPAASASRGARRTVRRSSRHRPGAARELERLRAHLRAVPPRGAPRSSMTMRGVGRALPGAGRAAQLAQAPHLAVERLAVGRTGQPAQQLARPGAAGWPRPGCVRARRARPRMRFARPMCGAFTQAAPQEGGQRCRSGRRSRAARRPAPPRGWRCRCRPAPGRGAAAVRGSGSVAELGRGR